MLSSEDLSIFVEGVCCYPKEHITVEDSPYITMQRITAF